MKNKAFEEKLNTIEKLVIALKSNSATNKDFKDYLIAMSDLRKFFAYKEIAEGIEKGDKAYLINFNNFHKDGCFFEIIEGTDYVESTIGDVYFDGNDWMVQFLDEDGEYSNEFKIEDYGKHWIIEKDFEDFRNNIDVEPR